MFKTSRSSLEFKVAAIKLFKRKRASISACFVEKQCIVGLKNGVLAMGSGDSWYTCWGYVAGHCGPGTEY